MHKEGNESGQDRKGKSKEKKKGKVFFSPLNKKEAVIQLNVHI